MSNIDFFHRLSHACAYRWGLVIEMMIEALTLCVLAQGKEISIDHFAEAFSKIHGVPRGFSPFTVEDYLETFDPDRLLSALDS